MNAAVSAGLLTIAASGNKALPASLHDRYSPQEADALAPGSAGDRSRRRHPGQ